jgi:hypothetical protein
VGEREVANAAGDLCQAQRTTQSVAPVTNRNVFNDIVVTHFQYMFNEDLITQLFIDGMSRPSMLQGKRLHISLNRNFKSLSHDQW